MNRRVTGMRAAANELPGFLVLKIAAILLCLAVFVLSARAQDDVIKIDTNLVTVPVSVLDRSGKYISTLKQADFKIFEDGVEQQINYFQTVEQPVTVLMLLERTGAISLQLPRLVDAANAFVRQMRPDDKLIAVTFGVGTDTVINETRVKDLKKGVKIERYANDKYVMLYEAVAYALLKLAKVEGRKAIVLFSVGRDPEMRSPSTFKGTLNNAEESGVTVFTIRFNSYIEGYTSDDLRKSRVYVESVARAQEYMSGLARRTGGRTFNVEQIENLDASFAEVAGELVRQYVLGYSPTKVGAAGERRRIKVQVTTPDVVVRVRKEVVYKKAKD